MYDETSGVDRDTGLKPVGSIMEKERSWGSIESSQ
jgi:hypothetical protein